LPHVTLDCAVRDRIARAGLILMDIRAPEVAMLSVQEETAFGSPLEPSKAKLSRDAVTLLAVDAQARYRAIECRCFRAPQVRLCDWRRQLLYERGLAGRDADLLCRQFRDRDAMVIEDSR
jgi:hypothetical protein